MNTRAAALTGVVLLAVAAGSACGAREGGAPRIEEDRSACAHCGMLISERAFAAAYRAPGGEPRVFDDIGCLLNAARREADRAALDYWFHDAPSVTWIDGRSATFIHAADLKTPMSGGMLAYRDAGVAAQAAARHRGRVLTSLEELLRKEAGS